MHVKQGWVLLPAVVLPAKYDDVTHVTNNARAL